MANNPDGKFETYHEVPGSKYFFISGPTGIAVHKKFFKYWSLFLISSTAVSTLIAAYTDWWQLLIIRVLTLFYVQYWPVGWGGTGIAVVVGYYWYSRRQKRLKKEKAAQARARKLQDMILAGGDKQK